MRKSITTKLAISFLLVILVFTLSVMLAVSTFNTFLAGASRMIDRAKEVALITDVNSEFFALDDQFNMYVMAANLNHPRLAAQTFTQAMVHEHAMIQYWRQARRVTDNPSGIVLLNRARQDMNQYMGYVKAEEQAIHQGKPDLAMRIQTISNLTTSNDLSLILLQINRNEKRFFGSQVQTLRTDALSRSWQLGWIAIFFAVVETGIFLFLWLRMVRPIVEIAGMARLVAHGEVGNMSLEPPVDARDEIGQLKVAFWELSRYVRQMALAARRMSEGDLTEDIPPRSASDILGEAFAIMQEQLRACRRQSERMHALIENLPDAVFFKDAEGKWEVVNGAGLRLFGLEGCDWNGHTDSEIAAMGSDLRTPLEACAIHDGDTWAAGQRYDFQENVVDHLTGRQSVWHTTKVPIFTASGERGGLLIICRDITLLVEAHRQRESYLETLRQLDEAVVELDLKGCLRSASEAWERLTGHTVSACIGQPIILWVAVEDRDACRSMIEQALRGTSGRVSIQFRLHHPAASSPWIEAQLDRIVDAEGRAEGLRGILRDITNRREQEARILEMAWHDPLTGLPNRNFLQERLQQILQGESTGSKMAIGFLDVDWFKTINDELGHKTGDRVLCEAARRLQSILRSGDTLSRWGGDEFVVILPEVMDVGAIREFEEKMHDVMYAPITEVDIENLHITLSGGFSFYPDDARDPDMLMKCADWALFYAKSQGRNNVRIYREVCDQGLQPPGFRLRNQLQEAIEKGQIQVYFQPVVDSQSGRPIGAEALARWHDPEAGWIRPDVFIPLAEEMGLIRDLGAQVMTEAIVQCKRWRAAGWQTRLLLNVSKHQLYDPRFITRLLETADRHGVASGELVLEVTETIAALDVAHASDRLNQLHEAGFRLAIDDFGTGYSSLSQLHIMPVDELKIDISFVQRIHTRSGRQLVQTICAMAKALDINIVAEGVEDDAAAQALREMGVESMQGFLFSKPLPPEEFLSYLNNQLA